MSVSRALTPPPDLEVVVQTARAGSGTRLTYTLNSPAGVVPFTYRPVAGPSFAGSPEEFHRRLVDQIEKLDRGLDAGGEPVLRYEVEDALVGLGRQLWRELFNEEMRLAYRRCREELHSLRIISDEPWIPWEMIKPYDEGLDDEFLAERFEMTRWLAGGEGAPGEIPVRELVCVAAGANLPKGGSECALVRGLARAGLEDVSPVPPRLTTLRALLEKGGIGLLHLTGHGTFEPGQPDEAGFLLADGSVFRPSQLHGPVQTQIGKDRPLVFLNACGSGRQGWSLTSLGGWAHRWVRLCGCGAFIGPQWPVRDSAAHAFADELYRALDRGDPLGQAAKAARQAARQARPGNPSWLAYAVYGHPNATVRFGEEARPAETGESQPLRRPSMSQEPPPAPRPPELAAASPQRTAPSRNLRINRQFTARDRDRFVEESFEEIASFFELSLAALQEQHSMIETTFRRVDRNQFSAAIYVTGADDKKEACRVSMRGRMGDIAYSPGDSERDNSYSEILNVVDDGTSLLFEPLLGLSFSGGPTRKALTPEEAAEHLWSKLIGRLQ